MRYAWELSVLVYGLENGLHARRDGLEVGQKLCVAAGGWVWYRGWRLWGCGMWGGGVGCWCAVMARCGRGAGESNVWASDLDSGDRLCGGLLVQDVRTSRRFERSRLMVSLAACGEAKGLRRGRAGGMSGCIRWDA